MLSESTAQSSMNGAVHCAHARATAVLSTSGTTVELINWSDGSTILMDTGATSHGYSALAAASSATSVSAGTASQLIQTEGTEPLTLSHALGANTSLLALGRKDSALVDTFKVSFSPQTQRLASRLVATFTTQTTGGDKDNVVVDAAASITCITFSLDGKTLYAATGSSVFAWDALRASSAAGARGAAAAAAGAGSSSSMGSSIVANKLRRSVAGLAASGTGLLVVGLTRGFVVLDVSKVRTVVTNDSNSNKNGFQVVKSVKSSDKFSALSVDPLGSFLFSSADSQDRNIQVWNLKSLASSSSKDDRAQAVGHLKFGSKRASRLLSLSCSSYSPDDSVHVLAVADSGLSVFNVARTDAGHSYKPASSFEIGQEQSNRVLASGFLPPAGDRALRLSVVLMDPLSTARWWFDPSYATPNAGPTGYSFIKTLELDTSFAEQESTSSHAAKKMASSAFSVMEAADSDKLPQKSIGATGADDSDQDIDMDPKERSLGEMAARLEESQRQLRELREGRGSGQTGRSSSSAQESGSSQPRADSLQAVLSQAIRTDDASLLASVLSVSDPLIIRNTTARLPTPLVLPLLKAAIERFSSKPGVTTSFPTGQDLGVGHRVMAGSAAAWIRSLLEHHASYLMSCPDLVKSLSGLYLTVEARLAVFRKLLKLSGRLDLVMSQVDRNMAAASATAAPATVFVDDDESDEDDDDEDEDDLDDGEVSMGDASNSESDSDDDDDDEESQDSDAWDVSVSDADAKEAESSEGSDEFALLELAAQERERKLKLSKADDDSSSAEGSDGEDSLDSEDLADLYSSDE